MVAVIATFLSIYTALSFVTAIAFTGDINELSSSTVEVCDDDTGELRKSKKTHDELGIVNNTLQLSKAGTENTLRMESQLTVAKEDYKQKEQEKLEAEQMKLEVQTLQIETLQVYNGKDYYNGLLSRSKLPEYDAEGKMVLNSIPDAELLDIRYPSNWTYEDFDVSVKESIKPLIPVVLEIEERTGINAVYLISIVAAETGWGTQLSGKNNYFNWSTTGVSYYPFETMDEVTNYTIKRYNKDYSRPEFYREFTVGGQVPEVITPKVVNIAYAKYNDGTINWRWSTVVCEIMAGISESRLQGYCKYER